jgi:micrococcal nuclease
MDAKGNMGLLRLLLRVLFPRRRVRPQYRPVPPREVAPPRFPPGQDETTPLYARRRMPATITGRGYVVDGDSIIIDKVMIRLAGIDAPELDQPYGQNAKQALMRLCRGQIIRATVDDSDHYDRTVATCHLPDGRDLSAEMVTCGMALDWPKFSGGRYRALEPPGIRKKLWRVDARQKGRFPPSKKA